MMKFFSDFAQHLEFTGDCITETFGERAFGSV
jgi:hypothetical protein